MVFGTAPVGFTYARRTSRISACSFDQPLPRAASVGEDGGSDRVFFPNRNSLNACLGSINASFKKQQLNRRASLLKRLALYLQIFYEKSRLRYIFPILVLVAYSFIGGFIFYTIESPEEERTLLKKREYLENEQAVLLEEVLRIENRVRSIHDDYRNSTMRNVQLKDYRSFAMNRLNKAVYWYVLQVYYLNDQESYKNSLLHPTNPELLWRAHFMSNFGRIDALKNYTQQLSDRCWEIGVEMNSKKVAKTKLLDSIELFHNWTGLHHVLTPTWTFWNSMFLAVTTYTTIGYGNVTAKSKMGKLAAMIYAVIGIPLVLMILHRLGHYFLLMLQKVWDWCIWLMELVSCVKNADKLRGRLLGEERETTMPVWLAIGIAGGWMFLCSAIFLKFERDWDYFKSFYFFFCSLTTIGYGDVTPTNSEDMFIIFGFIIIGLSLVSMCINVVQLKLENLFEELLMTLLEEYSGGEGDGIIDAEGIREKIGVVDLFKMWKKRRRKKRERERELLEQQAAAEEPAGEPLLGVPMPATSSSAESPPKPAVSRLTELRDLKKIFPFMAKRRRAVLLQEFHTRLHQLHKATQTEPVIFGNGGGGAGAFFPRPGPFNLTPSSSNGLPPPAGEARPLSVAQEIDECSTPRTASDPMTSSFQSAASSLDHSKKVSFSQTTSSSSQASSGRQRLKVSIHDLDGSSSSSSSSYARRYLPSRAKNNSSNASVQSAPNMAATSSQTVPEAYDLSARRWTFFETGKVPRGCPRGLVIPYMYTKRESPRTETTEMKRLISELDARLLHCQTLVSARSRPVSRASHCTASSQASSLHNIPPINKDPAP